MAAIAHLLGDRRRRPVAAISAELGHVPVSRMARGLGTFQATSGYGF